MDDKMRDKERDLEFLKLDHEIENEKAAIAEKKKMEKDMKKSEGSNWKHIMGIVGGIRPNREVIQDLYCAGADLKNLSRPKGIRKL